MTKQDRVTVPSGIDYLVSLAASDAKFRERFLSERLKAAKRAGVRLTDSEKTLLLAIPDEQLAAIIANANPSLAPRRSFLQKTMLWTAGLFGGVAMTTIAGAGCGSKGVQPDVPPPKTQGIRPDEPPDDDPGPVTGARPDVPDAKGE